MFNRAACIDHLLDLLDELGEKISGNERGLLNILDFLTVLLHETLVEKVRDVDGVIAFGFHELLKLLGNYTSFGILCQHAYFGVRFGGVQFVPNLGKDCLVVVFFGEKFQVVFLRVGMIFDRI